MLPMRRTHKQLGCFLIANHRFITSLNVYDVTKTGNEMSLSTGHCAMFFAAFCCILFLPSASYTGQLLVVVSYFQGAISVYTRFTTQ